MGATWKRNLGLIVKSCQPFYRIWNGLCRPVAGKRRPARELLYKDRVERDLLAV